VSELRALPFETRTIFFEAMSTPDEPSTSRPNEPLIQALEGLADKPLDMAPDEFFEFIIHASADEAREVLFAGAETGAQKRRAGAAFVSALAGLIRQGRITGPEIAERLAIAGQLQAGAA
jgi:hypothetical protein